MRTINQQLNRIMEQDLSVQLKTRDWQRLLTAEQKEKYRACINKGYFSDYHGNEWRHATFYGAYLWKNPGRLKVVAIFEDILGHRPTWEDITDDNLRDLFEELSEHYSPNSTRTLCATINAVIRENMDTRNIASENFGSILRKKKQVAQFVYLTPDEVDRVIRFNPKGKMQRYVQRMFVLECLCGARISDCMRISTDNIDETGRFLVYVTQKTHVEVRVPIHTKLRRFLVSGRPDESLRHMQSSSFNRILRDICKTCGINTRVKVVHRGKEQTGEKWQFVSSHTGRRSFATNLAKKGVAIEQIALMMGHSSGNFPNVTMTQGYVCGKLTLSSDVLQLFGIYDVPNATKTPQKEQVKIQTPAPPRRSYYHGGESELGEKFNVYYNDGVNNLARIGSYYSLEDAKRYALSRLGRRTHVDDDHPCDDDTFRSARVACFQVYQGEPIRVDTENGVIATANDPVYQTAYFYTD